MKMLNHIQSTSRKILSTLFWM